MVTQHKNAEARTGRKFVDNQQNRKKDIRYFQIDLDRSTLILKLEENASSLLEATSKQV